MNPELRELLTSALYLPSMHLCLEGLLMTQRAAASGPIMASPPAALHQWVCPLLACSDHRGSIEDQLACRYLQRDLAASIKPLCSQEKTSSQQTQDLGQEPLGMLRRRGREDCSTAEPKGPEANLHTTKGLGGGARKQLPRSPGLQPDSQRQGKGVRPDSQRSTGMKPDSQRSAGMKPDSQRSAGMRPDSQRQSTSMRPDSQRQSTSMRPDSQRQSTSMWPDSQQQSTGTKPDSQRQHTGMRPDPGQVLWTNGDCEDGEKCLANTQLFSAGETCLANTQLFSAGETCLANHKAVLREGTENQQPQQRQLEALRLLLLKQWEALEAGGLVKLREEVERLHLQEVSGMEQSRSVQLVAGFQRICEALKSKLSETERGSENLAGQLQALMEKYSRLRKRASSTKRRLQWEVKDKEQIQKRLEEMQRETVELAARQRLLLERREDTLKELSDSKSKFQVAAELREKAAREKQAVEEEASTLRSEVGRLTQELNRTQRESKRLARWARSRDMEREAGLKTLEELQDTVKRLYARLEHCSMEKQAVMEEMEALRQETKSLLNQQRVELLQLQEQQRGSAEREEVLRREADALAKLVSDLKQEKLEHIFALEQERARAEAKCAEEGSRLRAAICTLENERRLLLAEMEVLRKDYVALSDRIAQRMAQVETEEGPMSITEMALVVTPTCSKVN